jgi:hypothetical protein
MANPNPQAARQAKRRARKALDIPDVLRIMTVAIREAEIALLTASDVEITLKCVHALSQSCGMYAKLLEVGEFEGRLAAVEAAQAQRNGHR